MTMNKVGGLLSAAMFTALALMPMVSLAQIRIGQTSGFTGAVSASVNEINAGAKLYLDYVNEEGGIGGQKIELVSLDDMFQVNLAEANAKQLIADPRVVALFLNRGTPHAQKLLPLLEAGKIPLIAPSTGAMVLHEPVQPYVYNVRATYQREADKVIRHMGMGGFERVAVLYVDDAFGEDAVRGALKVFQQVGKQPALTERIDRMKPDYTKAAALIAEKKPLGVLIVGSQDSVAAGVRAIRAAGSKATIATLSNNAAQGFVTKLGEFAEGVIVSQVFPSERKLSVPMIAEAARLAASHKVKLSPAMMEGYAGAKVLVEALRKALKDSKEISRASLKKALDSLHVDIGGLEVKFSPKDHTGLDYADLSYIGGDASFRR